MHRQSIDDDFSSVTDLAYFEEDFWPNVIEEQIKELDQEKQAQAPIEVSVERNILCGRVTHYCVIGSVRLQVASWQRPISFR